LAGSGSNVPLARLLAKACAASVPGVRIEVDTGIGSSGGVRALRDGVIDLALVSRPLRPQEAGADMQVVPYARSPVAVAVHPAVTERGVSSDQLKAIFRGGHTVWPDGARVAPLQREQGDSGHEAMARAVAGWAEVDASAWQTARWPVYYHDQVLLDALLTTPGALGLVDGASVRALGLPLPLLSLDGRVPGAPDYPVWKPLAFVHRGPLSPSATAFLGCVRSVVGLDVLQRVGALPP
jgi:phosphate transport system substrate-binding protein